MITKVVKHQSAPAVMKEVKVCKPAQDQGVKALPVNYMNLTNINLELVDIK